ncbi:MAG: hypothetical protein NZ901_07145 [Geminocystis sp.]|nr:hypothetical protein [Geminocystis sp.]MCS7147951.1 hypothetical protein [Geminocystis sp.]MCX8078778.1 hypothetical protein [Geminocystis sp.]MDW8116854.1 hypothetical protein [Geminocystis sp.]HIK36593.1 hypothetical protein [Geminocystis sp. M7585_C2015_104]
MGVDISRYVVHGKQLIQTKREYKTMRLTDEQELNELMAQIKAAQAEFANFF